MRISTTRLRVLACLLFLSGCEQAAGPTSPLGVASNATSVTAQASDANASIISPFVQDVLREAAPDPIAALPVQVPPLHLAGTWSGEVLRRLGALALREVAAHYNGKESNEDLVAFFYKDIWWAPATMALAGGQAALRPWLTDTSTDTDPAESCAKARRTDEYRDRDDCGRLAKRTLAYALLRLAVGDQQTAEALYRQATAALPIGNGNVKCNHDMGDFPDAVDFQCVFFMELLAPYEGLTGRADDYAATMRTAISLPPRTRKWARIELPDDATGAWVYRLMRASGELQAFGRVADQMTTDKLFALWDVTEQLFEEIDRQAAAPGGHANAANLLAIAARLSTRPMGTAPHNRQPLRLALECHAGAVRALSPGGREQVAAMLPDMVDRYVGNEGEYFATGLCLYQLAGTLGRDDQRARVLAHADRSREQAIARTEQWARDYTGDDKDVVSHTAEMSHIIAQPWLHFLADNAALRQAILAALDKSKSSPRKVADYQDLMKLVLWVDMQQAG